MIKKSILENDKFFFRWSRQHTWSKSLLFSFRKKSIRSVFLSRVIKKKHVSKYLLRDIVLLHLKNIIFTKLSHTYGKKEAAVHNSSQICCLCSVFTNFHLSLILFRHSFQPQSASVPTVVRATRGRSWRGGRCSFIHVVRSDRS